MVSEVVAALVSDPEGSYVDATAGEAGHSRAILDALGSGGRLLCVDRDPAAAAAARDALSDYGERVRVLQSNFAALAELMAREGWGRADGIFLDLGLRSTALDEAERGFSFRQDGPLDMRFDPTRGETAADLLAGIEPVELARILAEGTSRANPHRLARAILQWRDRHGLRTTGDLTRCLRRSLGRRASPKLLASVYAALRMATNAEIEELEEALRTMPALLETGGVLCVICYQSQEDVRVKALGRAMLQDPRSGAAYRMKPRFAKPLRPSDEETQANPRARSARLRVLRRVPVTTPI